MRVVQGQWTSERGWSPDAAATLAGDSHVVFAFGSRGALSNGALAELRTLHPGAAILGCSTAGEICGTSGEISPFSQGASCELHNQTMTITTMTER